AARRTTRWFMLVALVVGVTMWDFYNAEYPVLRGHDPWQLFQTVFKEEAKKFEVHLAGGLAGFLAAIEAVGHYHGQVYGPSVDSVSLRAVLWIALLAKDAMQLSLVILLLSGVSGLMDIKRDRGWRVLGHTLFERTFMGTLVLLAAITVFGYSQMRQPPSPRT